MKLDNDIAFLDDWAHGYELDDLQISGDGRRGDLNGVLCFNVATDGDVIHKFAAFDLSGGHIGCVVPAKGQRTSANQEDGRSHRQHALIASEKLRSKISFHELGLRNRTAPFSTPERMTCSRSLALPNFTSRF